MSTYRDRGIVLKSKVLRDADRHYTIFTEHHGKIVVLAKGSRRGKSKMSPHLASFGVVDLMIAKGKIIDRLAGADLSVSYRGIITDLEKTAVAQSFLLTVDSLTRRELPEPRIFSLLIDFYHAMETGSGPSEGRSLLFDAAVQKLLGILGFAMELHACVRCRAPLSTEGNTLNIIRGGVECGNCADSTALGISAGAIDVLRFFSREPLGASLMREFAPAERREVAFITDLALTAHLETRFSALHYLRALV